MAALTPRYLQNFFMLFVRFVVIHSFVHLEYAHVTARSRVIYKCMDVVVQ